jgi:tetratricopeptide (TPR) repeat protein
VVSVRRVVSFAILLFILLIATSAMSVTKTFERKYTYNASEADSKLTCRAIALEQVKRLLLEELGTYLESETVIKNMKLTKDQITTLTAGIVSTEIIEEKWNGETYSLKARLMVDSKEVIRLIDKLRNDRQKTLELEESKKQAREAMAKVEQLRDELSSMKTRLNAEEQVRYNKAVKKLSAADLFDKAYVLQNEGKQKEAISVYTKVVKINPNYASAYINRGNAYSVLRQYQKAILDHDKAIAIDPNDAFAYINRGLVYARLRQYQKAILDYDKAIAIDPNEAVFYYNRGTLYARLRQYQKAILEFEKAIEINPNYASAYINRGYTYLSLRQYQKAILDYDKAIAIDPNEAVFYNHLGSAYFYLRQYQKAILEFEKAIEINPNYASAYYNIACVESIRKNIDSACRRLKESIELGLDDYELIKTDKDLDNIRNSSCYKTIMAGRKSQ